MEGADDIYRACSLQRGGSSLWTNNVSDAFSKSSRDEDDEEALKWAALERLPTFNRLQKGLLATSKGANEIYIQKLGFHERKGLLERLIDVSEEDNENFLKKLKSRIERVGIDLPTIEVRFEHLNIKAEAHAGSRALPSMINFCVDFAEGLFNYLHIIPSKKKQFSILEDVSGIIKPSRMTLLLGPPSSGKTTLLLALAGKLDPNLKFSGGVTYNGHGMNEFVPQRSAAYISQYDTHLGEMTVRETLAFAARCQGVGNRYEMLAELSRREKEASIKPDPDIDVFMKAIATEGQETSVMTDYIIKILGLEVCADIIVGNEMVRGISGGQRKRVTTGEMLVGPAKALFMDEISTGLDSSTTYQIVNSLKHSIHILNGTAVISLLQPAPETYDLFDDIILLSDGRIVKGVADFLQEITSRKDQQQYWMRKDEPYSFVTVEEFVEAFQSFHVGCRIGDALSTPFEKSQSHPAALKTRKYGIGKTELLKACFSREWLLMKRNSFVYFFKLTQLTVMSVIAMTLFLRTEMHKNSVSEGGVYSGALFYSLALMMFIGMPEISMTIGKFLSHSYRQLSGWALTYYVIGYDPDAGRFFKQYLLLAAVSLMASGLFRFIGGLGRSMIVANTFGSFALLILFALGGFVLSHDDIKKWWVWGYWISPLMYGQNAMVVNEFLGKSWSHVLPNSIEPLGIEVLKSRGFATDANWYWIGVGALGGFTILFNICYTLALAFLNPFRKSQAVISKDSESIKPGVTGRATPLSNRGSKHRDDTESISEANNQKQKGMILPFEPHSITFDDIKYSVDMPQEMKNQGILEDKLELLKGVSGAFRPGVLTALMGVSGAGKTTLMDVLAGRKTGGYIEGNITISGHPKKQETFARISGYCEQNDIHSPHVTVYESLLYSAWLRLPPEVDAETRKMFIEEVMELVELNPLRQALVGLPGVSGLSTEQRKRLTIAVELVANPSIIFMDEPTSVVCTIHQPSIDIFESFDELFLMKRGGQEIYVGPLGQHSSQLIKYFEGIDGVDEIRDGYNPATWMLEVTSLGHEASLGIDFASAYRNSELYRRNKGTYSGIKHPCSWFKGTSSFLRIAIALIFGTMFWNLGSKTKRKQDLFNAMGSMYAAIIFLGIQNSSSVQPVVAVERTVFYREKAAGLYSSMPYALAQILIELPYIFTQSLVYGVIVYAMIGFEWTAAKFLWYLFFMFFTLLYFTFYGMMTVAATPNQHIASIVSSAFYSVWNLFSGFIIPRPRIPVWWRWYAWICPVSWTLYGLVSSQFGDIKENLDTGETVEDFVRNYFGFKHELLGVAAAAVVGFATLFGLTFIMSIKFFNFQRR
ncbi:hypothetical protein OIU84_003573 [Salix udensis]|uniref:ABC transporter domain-containing protein n=1 Tax=Salix udensis TaxID=889485 RepID=A0AAD6P3B7_9ROSI|nr:hypothetical protein OIU84_003573 [Salix udensis]